MIYGFLSICGFQFLLEFMDGFPNFLQMVLDSFYVLDALGVYPALSRM